MSTLTHDASSDPVAARAGAGLVLALVSAASFGLAGPLARPLLDAGWSPGAVVLARIGFGAVIVLPFGLRSLHGRWHLLRTHLRIVVLYGLLAVAGAQFCYFSAIEYMQVGPALLIEYTAPAAVVMWLWLRHGERPGPVTLGGAGLCVLGLTLVLDLLSGADLSLTGVLWALGAMVGLATYFIINSDDSVDLPPLSLAAGGLVVGGAALGLAGLVGLLPMSASGSDVAYGGLDLGPLLPLAMLGLLTAAVSYVTGIAAGRRLGSRLASFVALSEVVAGVLWAWALLGELPGAPQLFGGLLVVGGVVVVKLGERSVESGPGVLVDGVLLDNSHPAAPA